MFTSNYEDIPDETEPNSLIFRIGHRMRSRLHEMCEFVVLDAADYRERPQNAGWTTSSPCGRCEKKSLPAPGRAGRQARAQLREPSVRDGRADLEMARRQGGIVEI